MKILIIGSDSRAFEPDSKVAEHLRALSAAAGSLTVIVPGARDQKRELSPHLSVYSVGGSKSLVFFKLLRLGRRLLTENRFDLISVQDAYFLALIGYRLSKRFQAPLELQAHGFEKCRGVRRLLASFLLPRAAVVRVVSGRLNNLLTARYLLPVSRIYVLPICPQIEAPPLSRQSHGAFTFLTVGRLVSVKNVSLLVGAFAVLASEFREARLVVVGAGPLAGSLKSQVRSLQLEGRVVFAGEQKGLDRYYDEADAFVLASNSEGYGLVVVEAAAHALPIVMTDVGLAGEFIRDEENGLIVPVGGRDALARAMMRIMREPELAKRLGQAARRAFEELPSTKEQIRKQVEVWRAIAEAATLKQRQRP